MVYHPHDRRARTKKQVRESDSSKGAPQYAERVQKLIAAAGICSRRDAEMLIQNGHVLVNGKPITIGATATRHDDIRVHGMPIEFPSMRYVMLHKPKGYVTTVDDFYGKRTVMELVPSEERLFPVGRLDKDTTGLLLLTNDGEFANRIMHPRYEVEKTYTATVDHKFDPKDKITLAQGVRLREGWVHARVRQFSTTRIEVTLHQGYNHVVKRILNELNYRVTALERTHIGALRLNIPLGAFRELTKDEVKLLLYGKRPQTPTKGSSSKPQSSRARNSRLSKPSPTRAPLLREKRLAAAGRGTSRATPGRQS